MPSLSAPNLATFSARASWLNRAGRLDRSACIELKASDLWRTIPSEDWRKRTRRRHGKSFLLADTQVAVSAYDLADLHDRQRPYTLQGDRRTNKSNVMKPPARHAQRSSLKGHPSSLKSQTSRLPASGGGSNFLGGNPNKGQSRTKLLGLPTDWSQPLTLQKWWMHASLTQHFFACPGCEGRSLKLFLPMCSEEELRDALTARLWLDSNKQRIARSATLRPQASRLLARYGVLFPPRQLRCRKCLGMRYGEVKSR